MRGLRRLASHYRLRLLIASAPQPMTCRYRLARLSARYRAVEEANRATDVLEHCETWRGRREIA